MKFAGSFGHWLKQRRKALDLTQQELAVEVGCAVVTIQKIETEYRRPSKHIIERLADALVVSPDDRAAFATFARRLPDNIPAPSGDLTSFAPAHNLPPPLTPFLGREKELAQIADRLADLGCRLLTLVGPGGIGKTRLALQTAAGQMERFPDGVYFVSLMPVGTTTLIAAAIASALQISFFSQEDPNVQVVNYLRGKHMLLVMDNYEHLLEGTELLTSLLANAPRLKILVTSRERLNVQEEWSLPIEGLPFPREESNDEVSSYSAIQLFVQSARRTQPNFSLDGNQRAVIDICQAVEGMPLGIELAAAWSRAMPCQQIAGQIRRDLDFLATSLRNVPARHRSLRAVFERSWNLLSDAEQGVLMKLSVFRGGIDPEAAEHVADASLLALLALVDKSLIRLAASGRYEMHELLRQFAADKLVESNGLAETRLRHLGYFLSLAETLERRLFGPPYVSCLSRLEIEHDNFRAALDWAERAGSTELGLRLASALGLFWYRRGYWMEGRDWLSKFLIDSNPVALEIRAKALPHLLELTFFLSDRRQLATLWPQALTAVREVRDPWVVAWLLCAMGGNGYEWERSRTYLEEALTLFRALDDKQGICGALWRLGQNHFQRGEFATADEFLQEGIKLAREADDKSELCFLLMMCGCKNSYQGVYDRATERLYEESLALFSEFRDPFNMTCVLCQLGKLAHLRGEDDRAVDCFEQGLRLGQQIGTKWMIVFCLMNLAEILCQRGEPKRGARLIGAVGDLVPVFFAQPSLTDRDGRLDYERAVAVARTQLGEAGFRAAYGEGQIMSLDQAIADTLTDTSPVQTE